MIGGMDWFHLAQDKYISNLKFMPFMIPSAECAHEVCAYTNFYSLVFRFY
jgi:hypothetical protein